jgi:hypothetical protein
LLPTETRKYVNLGLTAVAALDGNVHGVVVQMIKLSFFSIALLPSLTTNAT